MFLLPAYDPTAIAIAGLGTLAAATGLRILIFRQETPIGISMGADAGYAEIGELPNDGNGFTGMPVGHLSEIRLSPT